MKIRQVGIILFTITAVLTLAYIFRTPRIPQVDGTEEPTECTGDACTEITVKSEVEASPFQVEDEPATSKSLSVDELRMKFLETPYILDKFTIVTPTYRRTENLYRIFKNYCPMGDIVHKIIVLWNNIGEPVPDRITSEASNCSIPVIVKIMQKNNLTSRFIPYAEIETAAILSIDDDLLLPSDSLRLAFNAWKQFPYILIGYTARTYDRKFGKYYYRIIGGKSPYTMIMTNVAFIHRFYLELFMTTVPEEIIDYIVKTTNGEDLTMNVVIGKYLTEMDHPQPVGIKMSSLKHEIGNLSKSGYKGLWHRRDHQNQRTECLNRLAKAYGQLYLHATSVSISKKEDILKILV